MSAPESATPMDRRTLLRIAGGAAVAAGALPWSGTGAAHADVPTSKRFKLDGTGGQLLWKRPLHEKTWMLQSFGFDNTHQRGYFAQVKPGSDSGDLWITKTDVAGGELGAMKLRGFGHGVQIGVEPSGSGTYLWTESHATGSGFGSRMARFAFRDGATITPDSPGVQDRTPDLDNLNTNPQPAIDPVHDRLLVRFKNHNAKARIVVFTMDDAREGKLGTKQRLAEWGLPDRGEWGKTNPFQGFAGYGRYVYLLEGRKAGTSYLSCVDLNSGKVVHDRFPTTAGQSLTHREPEGMAIQLAGGRPRLAFGLSSRPDGVRDYRASVFYKDQLI